MCEQCYWQCDQPPASNTPNVHTQVESNLEAPTQRTQATRRKQEGRRREVLSTLDSGGCSPLRIAGYRYGCMSPVPLRHGTQMPLLSSRLLLSPLLKCSQGAWIHPCRAPRGDIRVDIRAGVSVDVHRCECRLDECRPRLIHGRAISRQHTPAEAHVHAHVYNGV